MGSWRQDNVRQLLHYPGMSLHRLLVLNLDIALGDESSVAVGEIRSADGDGKRVFARTGPSVVTGAYRVLVAWFLVHLGIALKRPAVGVERYRGHACVRAVHINCATVGAIIVVRK